MPASSNATARRTLEPASAVPALQVRNPLILMPNPLTMRICIRGTLREPQGSYHFAPTVQRYSSHVTWLTDERKWSRYS